MSDKDKPNLKQAKDEKLESLLDTINVEIGAYAHHLTSQITRLSQIGIALSSEHNLDKLLEMIVDEARRFTAADAGTLYILEDDHLNFMILQNESMDTRMGGTSGNVITLPPVPLSKSNVSAYVGMTSETINIPDVYEAVGFDFTGPRKYDEMTGYRTKSMLVVPMRNQDNDIIGVLQLINAKDPRTENVVAFSDDFVALTQSLASQAAVAVTNAKLISNMEELFDSFVRVMATAIDDKSPYTAGHIRRVAELGVLMLEVINETKDGPFADINFNEDQFKEMSIAGWMHDVGKIATPVHIMDKSTKLETIYDRVDLVKNRFQLIETMERAEWLERKMDMIEKGEPKEKISEEEKKAEEKLNKLREDLKFVVKSNAGGEFMDEEKLERIKEIGGRRFKLNGDEREYLTEDEILNLCIRKGTLLDSERKIMQDHIIGTIKMLEQIPFTKKLKNVPLFAGGHHESIDGSGYPKGLKGDELPLEARILCLVDFYEALTAVDRPYKKPMPLEKVYAILKSEAERNHIDKDLFDLFLKANVHERYTKSKKSDEKQENEGEPEKEEKPQPVGAAGNGKKEALGKNPLNKS